MDKHVCPANFKTAWTVFIQISAKNAKQAIDWLMTVDAKKSQYAMFQIVLYVSHKDSTNAKFVKTHSTELPTINVNQNQDVL